jgi:hypothetical protein
MRTVECCCNWFEPDAALQCRMVWGDVVWGSVVGRMTASVGFCVWQGGRQEGTLLLGAAQRCSRQLLQQPAALHPRQSSSASSAVAAALEDACCCCGHGRAQHHQQWRLLLWMVPALAAAVCALLRSAHMQGCACGCVQCNLGWFVRREGKGWLGFWVVSWPGVC